AAAGGGGGAGRGQARGPDEGRGRACDREHQRDPDEPRRRLTLHGAEADRRADVAVNALQLLGALRLVEPAPRRVRDLAQSLTIDRHWVLLTSRPDRALVGSEGDRRDRDA